MLHMLRGAAGTWPAKVIILLLVISFGVWGVSGNILGGAGNTVVEVGNTKVTTNDYLLAYERQRYALSQQFGRLLNRNEARAFGLDNNVLSQLVSSAVLDENASQMGLGLSSQNLASLIGQDTAFQDTSGNFNRDLLRQALQQIRMSEKDYVLSRQNVAVRNQLIEGLLANAAAPQAYFDAYDSYLNELRVFKYMVLGPSVLDAVPEPTEEDLKSYFATNKTRYLAPEYRKITIVKLEAEDIADPEAVSAEEVSEEYEARKTTFSEPETRELEQLSFANVEEAQAASETLKGGMAFDDLVAELGKTADEIKLGKFSKSALPDPAVADAAFALKEGDASEVVTGIFGPVIVRATKIVPQQIKPLSAVEKELRESIATAKASEELYEIHDRLEDERAAGDTLADAAKKVQLTPRIIEAIDATGKLDDGTQLTDLPESARLLREVFDTAEGVETDPIPIGSSGFVWYDVQGIELQRQKTLDEVREQVIEEWKGDEIAAGVQAKAEEILKRVDEGQTIVDARDAVLGEKAVNFAVTDSAQLSRDGASDALPGSAVKAAFAKPLNAVLIEAGTTAQQRVILRVAKIEQGAGKSVTPQQKESIDSSIADDILTQMIENLREKEEVLVNQQAINIVQSELR